MTMSFNEGKSILQKEAIDKLIHNLELGHSGHKLFTPEEYMRFYTVVSDLASRSLEKDKLYGLYQKTFEDYTSSKILPRLRCNENDNLLRELLRGWSNHKIMTKWLSGFFQYLPRFCPRPPLVQTSHLIFYDRVCLQIMDQVSRAIASLVDREREGEEIDRAMLKQVVDIFEEIGEAAWSHLEEIRDEALKVYSKDIEEALLEATARFYSNKALDWIATKSYEDYMLKVEECLEKEESRVSDYLRLTKKRKLIEVVQHELLSVPADKLEKKKIFSRFKRSRL